MNNKKELMVLGLFIFGIIILINSVSAYTYTYSGYSGNGYGLFGVDIRSGSENFINLVVGWAEPFLAALLGGEYYSGTLLFERFLIFILLLSMVYISLNQVSFFQDQKKILIVISVVVPLLAVRFLDFVWINTIILQYQWLGIALTGLLPFVIYLYFVHNVFPSSAVPRKIAWIFFIVIYFGLWSTTETETYAEIYFWTMIVSFLFLLFDGTIHRTLLRQKWAEANNSGFADALVRLNRQIEDMQNAKGIDENRRKIELQKMYRRQRYLQKQLT